MRKNIIGFVFLALIGANTSAYGKSYIREYTYIATELDTKESCQVLVLDHMKSILLQELGTNIRQKITIRKDSTGRQYASEDVEALTAGFTRSIILDEKWDGKNYYMKAVFEADPEQVLESLDNFKKHEEEKKQLISELKANQRLLQVSRKEVDKLKDKLRVASTAKEKKTIAKQYKQQVRTISLLEMYNKGLEYDSQGKYVEAASWYEKAANNGKGIVGAILNLANYYSDGKGVPKNPKEAIRLYEAVSHGKDFSFGSNNLALMYYYGEGVDVDYAKAKYWAEKAISQGSGNACHTLANMYDNGNGVAEDKAKAFKYMKMGAERGSALSQLDLADYYRNGDGVAKDLSKAFYWNTKAAMQGFKKAQYNLGLDNYFGNGTPVNYEKAKEWFTRAAEQESASAQDSLCRMYISGKGVTVNHQKAFTWCKRAAENGYADAQYTLFKMYGTGQGVEKDMSAAVKWFGSAYKQGHETAVKNVEGAPDALYEVGRIYFKGKGVDKNIEVAEEWYIKGAEAGGLRAMSALAWNYAVCGFACDGKKAVFWANKLLTQSKKLSAREYDTAAAAYARAGDYTEAVKYQKKAIPFAKDDRQAERLKARLGLYLSGKPFNR